MTARPARVPTTADVRRITVIDDPVIRNLNITQCYHEMALALHDVSGDGANWCAVATWASKQAGQSIRKEDLVRSLEDLLQQLATAPPPGLESETTAPEIAGIAWPDIGAAVSLLKDAISPSAAFERTSQAVARGNKKVFEEIGYEFARFLALFRSGRLDDAKFGAFLEDLQPGDPPDGQRLLRQAFRHYVNALQESDARLRAEWMFLANLEIGFHEQTRLQPEILEALDSPFYEPGPLRQAMLEALIPDPTARRELTQFPLSARARPLFDLRDAMTDRLQQAARVVITERMMTLHVGNDETLFLGRDLRREFPAILRRLDNADLRELLQRIDPTPDSVQSTGAKDWGRLDDRMHFIGDLFRAYHLDPALFHHPFVTTQVIALRRGQLPPGRL
ncbi:MAG: hypothetical protein J5I90_21570 [Caldilineales bacterium]|nr:hypothetical protein [Caldilineales bacterium]